MDCKIQKNISKKTTQNKKNMIECRMKFEKNGKMVLEHMVVSLPNTN